MKHQPLIKESLKEHDRLARVCFEKAMKASLSGKSEVCFLYSRLAKFHGEFKSKYEAAKIYFEETCRSEIFEVRPQMGRFEINVDYQSETGENRPEVNIIYRPEIFEVVLGR